MGYTPDYIDTLLPKQIFVFGSNALGYHTGGASGTARKKFGAVWGQAEGLQGQCYAIPVDYGKHVRKDKEVKEAVERFIAFAKDHPDLFFLVTRVGCGIAGYHDEEIAQFFVGALELKNVSLPKSFVDALGGGEAHYDLERFVEAQQLDYVSALNEVKEGEKRGHWIWYIFPQIQGLGHSMNAVYYGISCLDEAKAYLEQLARYWVARYSAYPTIWTLGQEVDNDPYQDENSEWNAVNNPYKYLAEYLGKYDPYAHPVTAHQESTGNTVAYGNGLGTGEVHMIWYPGAQPSAFRHVDAHTMYAAQWHPHLTKRDDYMSARDYWYNGQGKPVVNFEGLYCYLWTKNYGARAQAWASYLTGLYGCAWGGQPTWAYNNGFQKDIPSDDGVDLIRPEEKQAPDWPDALEYPSSYQMGYMRTFMEQTEWYNLIPRFNNWAYFVPSSNVYAYCASNKKNTEMVLYFYSYTDPSIAERLNTKKDGGILTGTVGSLVPFGKYNYQWFDPIHGKTVDSGTFRASAIGTWFAGLRPDDTDMVLLIQKA